MIWHQQEVSDLALQTFKGAPVTIEYSPVGDRAWLKSNVHYPPDFDSSKKYPAVLMLHGLGGSRDEHNGLFVKTAAVLALSGFIALRIDVRGAGETGGDTQYLSIETEVEDASAAFDHLQHLDFIDRHRIAILGLSFGGLVGSILAGRRRDEIASNVIWEGPHDMVATTRRLQGSHAVDEVDTRGYLQAGSLRLGKCFFDTLNALDVNATIKDFARPVLIVQGGRDSVVLPEDAFIWQRSYIATDARLHMIEEADHAFTQDEWAWEAIETTVSWLLERLE